MGAFEVTSIAFSPDGRFILTAEDHDRTACLWETFTGREIRRFERSGNPEELYGKPRAGSLGVSSRVFSQSPVKGGTPQMM